MHDNWSSKQDQGRNKESGGKGTSNKLHMEGREQSLKLNRVTQNKRKGKRTKEKNGKIRMLMFNQLRVIKDRFVEQKYRSRWSPTRRANTRTKNDRKGAMDAISVTLN